MADLSTHACYLNVPIIGIHHSPLKQKFGLPRQPNLVALPSYIIMLYPFNDLQAFNGIEAFSHLWIFWHSHQNNGTQQPTDDSQNQPSFKSMVRPPRLGGNKKMGVFATRSTYRPSQLGMSVVRFKGISKQASELRLHIAGADMMDKTPIVDIKPYLAYSDAIDDCKNGFAETAPASKQVLLNDNARQQWQQLIQTVIKKCLSKTNNRQIKSTVGILKPSLSTDQKTTYADEPPFASDDHILTPQDLQYIKQLIAQDPRPAYKQASTDTFYMRYKQLDVAFARLDAQTLVITQIKASS